MLSRASSDAGTRLRRSKSTSTVHSYRHPVADSLDPEVSQKHALAAATTAFVRAHAKDMGQKPSTEVGRARSNTSRSSQRSHFPPRGSSFRSLQPGGTVQASVVSRQSRTSTMATEKFPPFHVTSSVGKSVSAQPSITFHENSRPSSQLSASGKLHRPNVASSMASQQIRKARSMYYASSVQTGSPIPRPPVKYLVTPPSVSPAIGSSVLSSHSGETTFRRPRSSAVSPLVSPRLPVTVAPGETVDNARDKYLQNFQQRQVKHRPSIFLAPFRKRQDKAKNRASSSLSEPNRTYTLTGDGSDKSLREFKPPKEKRSFSNSLRNKFKKVFRKTSKETTVFPLQQAEASRDYFGDFASRANGSPGMHSILNIPSPDENTLQRVRSRSPSLDGRYSSHARPSSRGSNRSLHSETEMSLATASRVTSWSNSSICGALTQREIKRLTVIHEAKDSIGSETSRKNLNASLGREQSSQSGLSAFRDPMPMESAVEEATTTIDPKRVFSALMKEIDASSVSYAQSSTSLTDVTREVPNNESDIFVVDTGNEPFSAATHVLQHSLSKEYRPRTTSDERRGVTYFRTGSAAKQSKASSVKANSVKAGSFKASSIRSFGRAIKSTIRAVTPSEVKLPMGNEKPPSIRGAVGIPKQPTSVSSPASDVDSLDHGVYDSEAGKVCVRMPSGDPPHRCFTPEQVYVTTKEQIERRVQKAQSRWKTPPDEAERTQISRPMNRQFSFSSISQRIFAQKPTESNSDLRHRSAETKEDDPEAQKCPVPSQSHHSGNILSPLSPSVYSRNTDGISLFPNDSVLSLDATFDDDGSGSAIVSPSQAVFSYVIGTPTRQRGRHSTRSSKDWRAWLSREVSELDFSPQEDFTIGDQYTTPSRHQREHAQITNERPMDVEINETFPVSALQQQQTTELCTPPDRTDQRETSIHLKPSLDSIPKLHIAEEVTTARKVPSRQAYSLVPLNKRPSSIPSSSSSSSRPASTLQTAERMNERFPFIKSGRRSSCNSARLSRHTPSSAGSGSSSPSPRVYSDFSAPSSKHIAKYECNTSSKRTEGLDAEKENKKENTSISVSEKKPTPVPRTPQTIARPKSLQMLSSSTINRTHSSQGQYAASAEDGDKKQAASPPSALPRVRLRLQHSSPGKPNLRPRSSFDLRRTETPPLAPTSQDHHANQSPQKGDRYQPAAIVQRKLATGRTLEGHTLRTILDNTNAAKVSGSSSLCSSPNGTAADLRKPELYMETSTSTLSLNKEPSPGADDRHIDALLGSGHTRERYYVRERGTGSISPGQRMADRFLVERSGGSGAGSPVSVVNVGIDEPKPRRKLQREDTPAFL